MLHHGDYQDTPLAQDFAESDDGFRASRDQTRPVWEGLCAHGDLHLDSCDPSLVSSQDFAESDLGLRLPETEFELWNTVCTHEGPAIRYLIFLIPEYFHNYTLVKTTLHSDYSETKLPDNDSMFEVFTLESKLKAVAKMDLTEDYFKAKHSLGHIYLFGKDWLYTEY